MKTLNLTTLDTIIDKIENSEALIKIRLKEDDYQPRVTQKIKDFSKKANIKGFRPGKVPPGVIKRMYGNSFLLEEVNKILSEELNNVLRKEEIQFLGEPLPSEDQENIDWTNQKEFEFVFNIGYAEEFEMKPDKKVKVEKYHIKVDDKLIDETIDNLRNQFGELTNPDTLSEKDTLYGPIKNSDGSIDKEISISLNELKDSVAKKLIGKKVGEIIEIDSKKSFKESDYFKGQSGLSEEEIKNSKGKFSFELKGINHVVPAEINQDLFDKTFGKDSVKSEDDFKAKVKETIQNNYAAEEENYFNHKLKETLVSKLKIDLPDIFLRKWLMKTNENLTDDLLDTEYEQYGKELKWSLIRSKISKDNEIKVEHAEVVDQAKKLISQQFGGAAAQLGDQLDTFADNYLQGENGDNYMKVFNQVMSDKVFEHLSTVITTKEKEVSLDEFRKLS